MFGSTPPPQNEASEFHPRSPYGVSKVFSYWASVNYRESFGIHASNGILFNHESPRRGENFVTRKIAKAAAAISLGLQEKVELGNLDARRDWGYAPEYVGAMWLMLQQDKPQDFVIATGTTITLEEFVKTSFEQANLNWKDYVIQDPSLFRPTDLAIGRADPSKAQKILDWEASTKGIEVVKKMYQSL
jgi:GDPmannose 4,6-dehydratase